MKIDIIADTICPWCYVGKKRFDRALEMRPQDDLEVGWRACQLNPSMPKQGLDRKEYVAGKFGGLARARSVHGSLEVAGEEEGIKFNFEKHKLVTEGAAATSIMAVKDQLSSHFGKNTICLLCGGNIDSELFGKIIS